MRRISKNRASTTRTSGLVSRPAFLLVALLAMVALLLGCSDEKGPTVPTKTVTPQEITVHRNQDISIGMLSICPAPKLFFSITRGTFDVFLGAETAATHSGFSGQTWYVEIKDEKFLRIIDQIGKRHDFPQEYITVKPAGDVVQDGHILIGDAKDNLRPYRGSFKIVIENDRLLAINIVPMEEYLLGVVPAEMQPTWPEEALKAQAVAARSYAYYNLGRFGYRSFDLADTVISQAYAGVFAETEATTVAVVDTEGEVLLYKGNLANCLYHSTCGGMGASSAEIFNPNHEVPYLVAHEDVAPWGHYCEASPLYKWEHTYNLETMTDALRKSVHTDPGAKLSSLTIASRTPSDWVGTIYISGQRDHVAKGSEFRAALNKYIEPNAIPSTNFDIDFIDGVYHLTGKGFGHGVGMCQWGAKGRAEEGIHYNNILRHYYPGCEIYEISMVEGLTFYRDEEYFLFGKRDRKKDEIEGLGGDYLPPEEMEEGEGESVAEQSETENDI